MMKAEDVEGLTLAQIKSQYALPNMPVYISEVHVPSGTRWREGVVNPIFEGEGNATQYEVISERIPDWYTNTMVISN